MCFIDNSEPFCFFGIITSFWMNTILIYICIKCGRYNPSMRISSRLTINTYKLHRHTFYTCLFFKFS